MGLTAALLEIRRDPLAFVERSAREHDDLVVLTLGPRRLCLVHHPDLARQVLREKANSYAKGIGLVDAAPLIGRGLLTSDGDHWRGQHQELARWFKPSRTAAQMPAAVAEVDAQMERWRSQADFPAGLDLTSDLDALSLRVAARALLGLDLGKRAPRIAADLREVAGWAMRRATSVLRLPLSAPTFRNRRCRAAVRRLNEAAAAALASADACELRPSLARSVGAQDPGDPRVREQLLTLLLAGYDTMASCLGWTLGLLATHNDVAKELHHEIEQVLGPRSPVSSDVPKLTLCARVLDEAMRLYPPVWLIPRRAREADKLHGHLISPGTDVLVSVFSIHRHPKFWSAPTTFDPDRFLTPAGRRAAQQAYLPFGLGPRACLGRTFAMSEGCLVLARIMQHYRLESESERLPRPEGLLTLRPRGGLRVRLAALPGR